MSHGPSLRHREEVVNTQLAILLSRHGVSAEAETIHNAGQARPDVMFLMAGLRVIIEGKFGDIGDAEAAVMADARGRVQSGICHIAVALVYPKTFRTISTTKLEAALSTTRMKFAVLSESGNTEWSQALPDEILGSLRRVHESLTKDDIVAVSAKKLSDRIENIAELWSGQPAVCDRLATLLGMPVKRGETSEEKDARRATATKVAALVLANAMIFQEQLASSGGDGRIDSLRSYDNEVDPIGKIKQHWHWIWTRIDYVPIFQIGEEILGEIPVSHASIASVRWLVSDAKEICANQSALRHDLMGRIYHWLLNYSKYLGTYYTATSSATLLLKLTFSLKWDGQDFGSPKKLVDFAAADLTCGTGTLLMATAQAITDQFVIARVKSRRTISPLDLKHLHETLMENVLHGYDVLASAVHLTASTLGMLAPEVTYRKMNLFVMPMGVDGRSLRLGSLDFMDHNTVSTQLSLDDRQMEVRQTGVTSEHYAKASVPTLDLCVMNPPFVRSVGGNLLFGSLADDERAKLQTELKLRAKPLRASITAGLGSVFLAIADKHLRVGGRLAFILPIAMATGEAWGASRQLLAAGYHLETVIVSHDSARHNFSENTDLSEIMFIARKLKKNEFAGNTTYVNLWHNPRTIYEALDVASHVVESAGALTGNGVARSAMGSNGRKFAEVVSLPAAVNDDQWVAVQFAQTLALHSAMQLTQHIVSVPGHPAVSVALSRLGDLGTLGFDQRDIHDAFTVSYSDWSPTPSFWNHNARTVTAIKQQKNSHLIERTVAAPGRKLKASNKLRGSAGRILLVERVRTTTHKVLAVRFDEPVIGNTWWAFNSALSLKQEKALLVWLNSTPSLLLALARRVTTEGAWMKLKKPSWEGMPVLNVIALSDEVVANLASAYDRLADLPLSALAKLAEDEVRAALDDALSTALGLPNLKPLRELLAREPGLSGRGLSPTLGQSELFGLTKSEQTTSLQIELL